MRKNRTSPIWLPTKEVFAEVCKKATTLAAILRHFGLTAQAGNYPSLKKRIKEDSVDISHITLGLNHNLNKISHKRETKDGFLQALSIDNGASLYRSKVKLNIIRHDLLKHDTCSLCGIPTIWNNLPLVLQLDHINGVNNDNRLENLRFICANCHSQTSTFTGKHKRKIKCHCVVCGTVTDNKRKYCDEHKHIPSVNRTKKVSSEEIEHITTAVWSTSLRELARGYNMSDNGFKKLCIRNNILLPPKHYITRRKFGYSHEDALTKQTKTDNTPRKSLANVDLLVIKNCLIEEKTLRKAAKRLGFSHKSLGKFLIKNNLITKKDRYHFDINFAVVAQR